MHTIDNNLKNEFTILVKEETHNLICDSKIDDHITNEIVNYIETSDKKHLINAGAMVMSIYCENTCDYEPISWASMKEFSQYPLIQYVKLFLEVWSRTDNIIFMIELYEVLSKTYHK